MFLNIFACVGLFFKGWAAFEPKQFAKNWKVHRSEINICLCEKGVSDMTGLDLSHHL